MTSGVVLRSRELAELAGTTPRALRHYHKIGLLPEVPRDSNGYRRYSPRDLVRVLRIRQLAASGMPLRKIGGVLEHDLHDQEDVLAALDDELKEQADRIDAQRQMIARLRREMFAASSRGSGHMSATQRLDRDMWTLMTAPGGVDAATADAMLDVVRDGLAAGEAVAWYPEFERLETREHIDAVDAERLAEQIAGFARMVMAESGIAPADEELPIMTLVERLQADTLSPAQRDVWERFRALIERPAAGGTGGPPNGESGT